MPALFSCNYRSPRLNVMDIAFDADDADQVSQFKWFLQQEQNAREKILQNISECKPDRNRSNSQHLD